MLLVPRYIDDSRSQPRSLARVKNGVAFAYVPSIGLVDLATKAKSTTVSGTPGTIPGNDGDYLTGSSFAANFLHPTYMGLNNGQPVTLVLVAN